MKTIDSLWINGQTYWLRSGVDPNIHAAFFDISQTGVAALKPEFRGAAPKTTYPDAISDRGVGLPGSRNAELPQQLIIPETVCALAEGIFYGNLAIRVVRLPDGVTQLPNGCFRESRVRQLENTEQVTAIGKNAFHKSDLQRAYFPNLQTMGTTAFCQCSRLTYAHIGKVTAIPNDAFFVTRYLSCIENDGVITSVGTTALQNTNGLVKADFVKDVTKAGAGAFACTGLDFDWSLLPAAGMGTNATPQQYNPKSSDFWSQCQFTACENPLPTLLCQTDPRWKDRVVSIVPPDPNPVTYQRGCQLFCVLHAYCGMHRLPMLSVVEFEQILDKIDPTLLDNYYIKWTDIEKLAKPLGMTVTYYSEFNRENLQALYDALAAGHYAILGTTGGSTTGAMSGHVILAYGITANGELMLADSNFRYYHDQSAGGARYTLPYRSACAADNGSSTSFCILAKEA